MSNRINLKNVIKSITDLSKMEYVYEKIEPLGKNLLHILSVF